MAKYLLVVALFVAISLVYVMAAPASNDESAAVESSANAEVEDNETSATKKIKRGIYGGYGFGYNPYLYSFGNFGHLGLGYGIGYGHYPYYSGIHHGFGRSYLW